METRRLGTTDLDLSVIGFGAWALGGGGWAFSWGPQDDRASVAAIRRALELGVNWIDTAPVYGLGHSEEIVGQAIRGVSPRPVIATKCGLSWNAKGTKIKGALSAKIVEREVEDSLKRLGVERIDLYQIHWPTKDHDDLEAWAAIAGLVKQGKIRYAGVSNFSVPQLEAIGAVHAPASLQPPYSMLERGVEEAILPYCREHAIGVVAYSPMQCGLLTGRMTRERKAGFSPDDFRLKDSHFQEPAFSQTLEKVERLKALAKDAGRTTAQMAVAWVLRRPEVTAAIVGARSPSQIEETAAAGDVCLSEDEVLAVEEILKAS